MNMKSFLKKFNRVAIFALILTFLCSNFAYSQGSYLLRKPLGEDKRIEAALDYNDRAVVQIRQFAEDMLIKVEDLGVALYQLDKAVELPKTKKDIEESSKETLKALDSLTSALDEKKEIDGVPERICTEVMECYRNPLQIIVLVAGLLRDTDLGGEGSWIQDKQLTVVRNRIVLLKRNYDKLYRSAFKLSRIHRVPEKSASHIDFAKQCSDADPNELLERTKIAIFTFDHGPATDPIYYLHISINLLPVLIKSLEKRNEFKKVHTNLKKFDADFLEECNPAFLCDECVNILKMNKYDFMFMTAWHRELLRLAEATKTRLDELKKVFRDYQGLCQQHEITSDIKISQKWEAALQTAEETAGILENRYRFARGMVVKKAMNLEEIIRIASSDKNGIQYRNVTVNKRFSGPIYIQGEKRNLINAIANIIINGEYWAVEKNKEEGRVEIDIRVENNVVKISISDNGPGIQKDAIEDIFRFGYTTRGYGTGIGLAETRYVVQDYSGTINVESQLGQGTTFILRFPISKNLGLEGTFTSL